MFAASPAGLMERAPKVLGVALGTSRAELEARLGPCEALEAGGCVYWSRGVEFELAGGRVQRAVAHSKGDRSSLRSAAEPGEAKFRAFAGDVGGARIGQSVSEIEKQSTPTQRLRAVPTAADPAGEAGVYEYAERGLALEISEARVIRIHVPIAPARAPEAALEPPR